MSTARERVASSVSRASRARESTDRGVALAALAVWVAHGVVDNLATAGVIYYHGTTVYESNEVLRALFVESMIAAYQYDTAAFLLAPIAAKAAVAGLAALLILALPRYVGRRATIGFAALAAGAGLLVVINNLSALAAIGWSL